MGVGLRATDLARGIVLRCSHGIQGGIFAPPSLSCRTSKNVVTMRRHLLSGEGRFAHSAGNTQTGGASAYDIRIIRDKL